MLINKCGKFYNIKKQDTETSENILERGWFIVNHLHSESIDINKNFKETERNSRLWYNIKVLQCSYNDNIHKKIQEIEDKIFV